MGEMVQLKPRNSFPSALNHKPGYIKLKGLKKNKI